ncbi:unnamed protein product [Knipowitschia caucasica]
MIATIQNLKKAAYHGANPYAIDVFQTKRKDLTHGIFHTGDLLDHAVREGLISTKERSIILTMRTRHEQNSKILGTIEERGERACRKFFYPCLMRADPELYHLICEYVMTVNEYIQDTERQLIGYLLEQDQQLMHEVMKRKTSQRNSVMLILKEDCFKSPLDLPLIRHMPVESNEVMGKIEMTNNRTQTKTQANDELLIHPEAEDLRTPRRIETTEEPPEAQETSQTLHRAAQEDDWQQVETIVQNGALIEALDCQNKTALFYAVAKRNENTVTALLKAGATVHWEMINEAIKQNQNSVLKMLIGNNRGSVSEERIHSAIFSAVRQNKATALLSLIKSEANINIFDKHGFTPLLLSAEMGHSEVFRVLFEKQADMNAKLSNHSSVMHLAAQGGSLPIMKALLEKGLNPNSTGPKAQTPLHLAAAFNKPAIVHVLLAAGAQMNSMAQDGVTPLHVACQHGNEEIVSCLIKHKARVDDVDKLGRTALHWASVAPKASNSMSVLLSSKVNVNALDNDKRSALHLAAMEGKLQNVTSLLSHKAKTGAKDKNRSTPLHYAAAGGHVSIVSALLRSVKMKSIDERNTWKKTALHVAAEKGHDKVVSLLLEAGAKITSTDQSKDTPLHCAVQGGHLEVVKTLVDWGQGRQKKADLQATNSVGKTPLQLALSRDGPEHRNIATILKKKMLLVK